MPNQASGTFASQTKTQTSNIPEANPSDVASIDAIITAAYEVMS
jgi:hypothetical protein